MQSAVRVSVNISVNVRDNVRVRIRVATQARYAARPNFFRNKTWYGETKSHKIWDQRVEPSQNFGHFKLRRVEG